MADFITHPAVCRMLRERVEADGGNPIWVGMDAMSSDYAAAVKRGLITQEQSDRAQAHYGWKLFHYAGC